MTTISEKQLEANRQNAQLGGVKSEEGKQIVRFNARKHGILGNLVATYEKDFYNNYLEQLFDELQPASFIENILVERIALYYLKLYRLTKAEAEFMRTCL
jgi:MOSC domain-containing protein YiiM